MKIVPLTAESIPQILELENINEPYYFLTTQEELDYIFSHPKTCSALGIVYNDKLIAWGCFFTDYGNAKDGAYEIFAIFIGKTFRGRGLGEKMLQALIDRIQRTKNHKEIYLVTSPFNIPALLLYLKSGFIITDFKKDYFGPKENRVVLTYSK